MGKFFVQGTVEPGFEPVKELFAKNIRNGTESNAQLCVYHRGRKVVDLWGSACGDPKFGPESLVNVFSATKSVSSICMAALIDRGLLKYEDKVSQHWPAFGKLGKENITVADVLRHEAGLPTLSKSLRSEHISRKCIKANVIGQVIEETSPHFPPKSFGSVREYHAVTRGWILNEIFRRVEPKGRTIGEYLRAEISGPLGIDVYIGVEEDELKRFSSLQTWHWSKVMAQSMIPEMFGRKIEPNMATIVLKAFKVVSTSRELERTQPTRQPVVEGMEKIKNPANIFPNFNNKEVRMGEIPSANGSCTARGLAKLAQCILNGGEFNSVRILSTSVVERMQDKPVKRKDFAFSGVQNYFSQGGVNHFVIPLCLTKRSSTPAKAFKRYLHTGGMVEEIYKIIPWESTHVLDTINRYHRLAAQKIRAMSKEQRDTLALLQFQDLPQHPYALSSTDRGLLEVLQTMDYPSTHMGRKLFQEYRQTHVVFSDTDMALVHLAFFATFVQHPISYGGGGIGEQDLDAFLHYWRVIGYYLGVKEDLNLAGGGSQSELCAVWRALSKQLLYPYLQILDGVALKMVKALTTANDLNLGLIMFSSMEVNGNELSELWNKFPVHTKFLYYWRRFFMECLYRTRYFRITINWLLSTVTTRLLEKLGPYSPLETDV